MSENILGWTLLFSIPALVLYVAYRLHKRAKLRRERELRKEQEWRELKEQHKKTMRQAREARRASQEQTVSNNSVGVQSRSTVTQNNVTDDTTAFDLATFILLNQTANSDSGRVRASVDYDSNSITVNEEPSRPSSSWSSDDDSPSRSSSWSSSSDSSSSWDSSSSSDTGSSSSWD